MKDNKRSVGYIRENSSMKPDFEKPKKKKKVAARKKNRTTAMKENNTNYG